MALLTSSTCAEVGNLYVGEQIFRREEVKDEDGVLTDSTVTGSMELPDGTTVSLTVTHEATGTYLVAFGPFTVRGPHDWVIQAAGPIYQVEKGRLWVKP